MRNTRLTGAAVGIALFIPLIVASLIVAPGAHAQGKYNPAMIDCKMVYNLSGWSLVVKRQSGEGKITCSNGQTANVKLDQTSVGLTAGKGKTIGGQAKMKALR